MAGDIFCLIEPAGQPSSGRDSSKAGGLSLGLLLVSNEIFSRSTGPDKNQAVAARLDRSGLQSGEPI